MTPASSSTWAGGEVETPGRDLREMSSGVPADANGLRPVQAGEFAGLRCESLDDRTHWVRWFVARGAVALYVTYNCGASERGREREAVERVVASLKCPLPQRHAEPLYGQSDLNKNDESSHLA